MDLMSKLKEWLNYASEITGLDMDNNAEKLAKLFNSTMGSTDPHVLRDALADMPGIHVRRSNNV